MWFRKNRPRRAIFRHFKKCDEGVTAIEFALVAGPFLFLLAVIFETGLMLFSEYVIENGVAQAARMIRTGEVQNSGMTKSEFKDVVCGNLATFLNCQANLYVDVRNFPNFAAISLPNPIAGNQLSPDVTTGAQFNPGPRLTVTVVRTYYEWNLFVPGISMLANIGTDKRLLSAGAVFRNEPF